MRILPVAATGLVALSLVLAGCASTPSQTTPNPAESVAGAPSETPHGDMSADPAAPKGSTALPSHAHAIVVDPSGDGFLIGTHDGIYSATADGQLGEQLGTPFDAMGLTAVGKDLIASGHPGPQTPKEWGTPNLGILRSTTDAETWEPVVYTGEKDFHALAAAPDGTAYGLATDSPDLLRSTDGGSTWSATGTALQLLTVAVDADGRVITPTPDGVLVSTDKGATFAAAPNAPALYRAAASPDGTRLVGVDADGGLWTTASIDAAWESIGNSTGVVQALAVNNAGAVLLVDDSGVTAVALPG